jgi:hypothetical protein
MVWIYEPGMLLNVFMFMQEALKKKDAGAGAGESGWW